MKDTSVSIAKSDYVFHSGQKVHKGVHGDHSYVYISGDPHRDDGTSPYAFESGTGWPSPDGTVWWIIYSAWVKDAYWDSYFSTELSTDAIAVEDDAASNTADYYTATQHHHEGGPNTRTDGAVFNGDALMPVDVTMTLDDGRGNISDVGLITNDGSSIEYAGKDGSIRIVWSD